MPNVQDTSILVSSFVDANEVGSDHFAAIHINVIVLQIQYVRVHGTIDRFVSVLYVNLGQDVI